jgi:hypothetical protein
MGRLWGAYGVKSPREQRFWWPIGCQPRGKPAIFAIVGLENSRQGASTDSGMKGADGHDQILFLTIPVSSKGTALSLRGRFALCGRYAFAEGGGERLRSMV